MLPDAVDVAGERVTFSAVERLEGGTTNAWFRITAERALPRGAVRALFDAAGLKLNRVMLVRWGPIVLPRDLPRGRSARVCASAESTTVSFGGSKSSGIAQAAAIRLRRSPWALLTSVTGPWLSRR